MKPLLLLLCLHSSYLPKLSTLCTNSFENNCEYRVELQFSICHSVFLRIMLFVVFRSFLFSAFCSTRRELFYVFGQSPSDACTARFETSEVTEFAFNRAAPGWVTSVAAPALQRERKSMRAQESVCGGFEKNQLLFTTLQAASGNSADTGGMCTHLPRDRERVSRRERASVTAEQQSEREKES